MYSNSDWDSLVSAMNRSQGPAGSPAATAYATGQHEYLGKQHQFSPLTGDYLGGPLSTLRGPASLPKRPVQISLAGGEAEPALQQYLAQGGTPAAGGGGAAKPSPGPVGDFFPPPWMSMAIGHADPAQAAPPAVPTSQNDSMPASMAAWLAGQKAKATGGTAPTPQDIQAQYLANGMPATNGPKTAEEYAASGGPHRMTIINGPNQRNVDFPAGGAAPTGPQIYNGPNAAAPVPPTPAGSTPTGPTIYNGPNLAGSTPTGMPSYEDTTRKLLPGAGSSLYPSPEQLQQVHAANLAERKTSLPEMQHFGGGGIPSEFQQKKDLLAQTGRQQVALKLIDAAMQRSKDIGAIALSPGSTAEKLAQMDILAKANAESKAEMRGLAKEGSGLPEDVRNQLTSSHKQVEDTYAKTRASMEEKEKLPTSPELWNAVGTAFGSKVNNAGTGLETPAGNFQAAALAKYLARTGPLQTPEAAKELAQMMTRLGNRAQISKELEQYLIRASNESRPFLDQKYFEPHQHGEYQVIPGKPVLGKATGAAPGGMTGYVIKGPGMPEVWYPPDQSPTSPYHDVLPTFSQSTRSAYQQQADVLGRLVAAFRQMEGK